MKAAVCYEFNKPLKIEEVTIDPPKENEVKIRIAATAICHSDIHSFKGEHGKPGLPAVGGHEVSGYIDEVGKGVTYVKAGDHVVVSLARAGCGKCHNCIIGLPHMCERKKARPRSEKKEFSLAMPGCYVNKKGVRLFQLAGTVAGFAEYVTVSEDNIVIIPDDMPMDSAALLGCGVISGFGAVMNRAKVQPLSSVVVMGVGGVGLNAIQGAAIAGANPVIAVDILDNKLEVAKLFGATHTINVKRDLYPVKTAWEITSGRGADYVFVATAGLSVLRQGFDMSSMNGMTVIIGHSSGENLSIFDPVELISGRMLTGCGMGQSRLRVDIPRLVDLYKSGRYKLDELVSGRYSLDNINEAIASSEKGEALRNVIVF
jgi:S-(hydroxymethyl)glutathione dehydrogenase/alcohol dehydrogenase